jgi:hypothetical protein
MQCPTHTNQKKETEDPKQAITWASEDFILHPYKLASLQMQRSGTNMTGTTFLSYTIETNPFDSMLQY